MYPSPSSPAEGTAPGRGGWACPSPGGCPPAPSPPPGPLPGTPPPPCRPPRRRSPAGGPAPAWPRRSAPAVRRGSAKCQYACSYGFAPPCKKDFDANRRLILDDAGPFLRQSLVLYSMRIKARRELPLALFAALAANALRPRRTYILGAGLAARPFGAFRALRGATRGFASGLHHL